MSVNRLPRTEFTLDVVEWIPYLPTITEISLTDDQLNEVYERAPVAKSSPYFATLAHDLPALINRTGLFSNVMRSPGGASNAERELAAVAVSRVNGCIYCASVHARLYAQYSKKQDVIERILDEGVETDLEDPRELAIVDFSVRLTNDPAGLNSADLQPLRDAGLDDLEIYDIAHAAAMFAWANRLMQTLGEGVSPE